MNDRERIIRYLDNDMTDIERKKIEADLSSDNSLKELFEEFIELNNLLDDNKKNKNSGDDYFSNLISRFRQRKVDTHKQFRLKIVGYAFSITLLLTGVYFLFIPIPVPLEDNEFSLTELSENLSDSDLKDVFRYMNGDNEQYNYIFDYLETEIDNLDELVSRVSETESELWSDFDINDLSAGISSIEADLVYSDLVNKNF